VSSLREAGAQEQVRVLADRAAAQIALDSPDAVANLVSSLREAGAQEQVRVLADRAAAHAPLDNPDAVSRLLTMLREAGAQEQVTVLADRAAAHAPLDNPDAVTRLLDRLKKAGVEGVDQLIHRLPAAGVFDLFVQNVGESSRFRFGQDTNGHPAEPWGWADLD
jgi:glycine cleavage system regulatory protein